MERNMKKKVVLYKRIPDSELARLEAHFSVTCFDGIHDSNRADFMRALADADAVLGSGYKLSADIFAGAQKLKVLSTISTGIDGFDVDYLTRHNVAIMHTPDVLTDTTADAIFALLMCAARRTTEVNNLITSGGWQGGIGADYFGVDVHHKTLGILGMGRIGYAVAKRAHLGFDMPINYYNRSVNSKAEQNLSATKMELEQLLAESDFICSILPATKETEQLIGEREFSLMKPSAIFINGGRGSSVDEEALISALESRTIRAAGLDVFNVEPLPSSSKLMRLDNVVMFPHIGSATSETRSVMIRCAGGNVIAVLNGDISKNCANRAQLTQS